MTPLEQIIPSLLSRNPSQEYLRDFVYLCQNIAAAYLRVKVARRRLLANAFGMGLDDLALDCVADLFERDENNQFTEIERYYGTMNVRWCSEEALFSATRRLVFSRVNEGLFRHYRDSDRSLSNTIRNLKIALRSGGNLVMIERNNETWVELDTPHPHTGALPLLPSELVEAWLGSDLRSPRNIRDLVDSFERVLREQEIYRKQYPLVGLALIFRSILQQTGSMEDPIVVEPNQFSPDEVREFVRLSVERTKTVMKPSYVEKGKLDGDTYSAYFDTITDILTSEFVNDDGIHSSYFESLKRRIRLLSEEQYRTHHRVYLEYLAKLTKQDFFESITNELKAAS